MKIRNGLLVIRYYDSFLFIVIFILIINYSLSLSCCRYQKLLTHFLLSTTNVFKVSIFFCYCHESSSCAEPLPVTSQSSLLYYVSHCCSCDLEMKSFPRYLWFEVHQKSGQYCLTLFHQLMQPVLIITISYHQSHHNLIYTFIKRLAQHNYSARKP